ncbi:MAG TPA: DUF4173 domain-containing protein, partial [Pseudonocardiaceae bacterium]|nr:DUF4173 domain-containing protein [Pseudonocardiaceae bacterium]
FTVLRLCVEVCELWLGGVYLLVIAGGVRLRLGWLPRTIVATGLSSLLVLAVVNPERLIAEQNVARYDETGRIDTWYLAHLSEDAIPGMAGLPDAVRDCTLRVMAYELGSESAGWQSWNASRSAGHAELVRDMATAVKC